MQELYEGIQLTDAQTEWICRGLLDLAAVDGVHESELALVADFYSGSSSSPEDVLAAMRAEGFDGAAAEAVKAGGEHLVEAFFITCYMLVYADGNHSDEERAKVAAFAQLFDLDQPTLDGLHRRARLFLLKEIAEGVRNRDAVLEIAGEMGLGTIDVEALADAAVLETAEEFYESLQLTDAQTRLIGRGLLTLAGADGEHPAEVALIADFCGLEDADTSEQLEALRQKGFDLAEAASALKGAQVEEAFFISCFLLIYADGEFSVEERVRITEFAEAFGVDDGRLEAMHTKARLFLLQTLADNLRNIDLVKQLGAEMGLTAHDLEKLEV
ncbi:MAG: hypothetical protein ACE366_04425 [Bradymonadia bacterium]